MYSAIIRLSLIGSAILIALSADMPNAFVMFILFGIVPYTNHMLPAATMQLIFVSTAGFLCALLLGSALRSVPGAIRRRSQTA